MQEKLECWKSGNNKGSFCWLIETPCAIFSEKNGESHLFQYHSQMKPGCNVKLLNANVNDIMRATNTTLFIQ